MFVWLTAASAAPPSVALYYAADAPLNELKAFDIVIVEADHGYDPQRYRKPYSELYAYVAIGEVQPSRPYAPLIPAERLLAANAGWGSQVVDLSWAEWPQFVAERVVAPLWEKGYRGFFLDTLDSYRLAVTFDETAQQRGLVAVIETLHRRFPGIRLILNRGFEVVPKVRDKVQMVAAESLFRGWNAAAGRYVEVAASDRDWLLGQLRRVRDEQGIPVLAIDYVAAHDRELARTTAERIKALGIVPWVADGALGSLGIGQVEVMPRRILAFYDGRVEPTPRYSDEHRYLEMPLNHLGYVVDYADVNAPLPPDLSAGRYAGVVSWLDSPPPAAGLFASWLKRQMRNGIPLALFGGLGGLPMDLAATTFAGLRTTRPATGTTLRIVQQDPMLGFEAPPAPDRRALQPLRFDGRAGRSLLELADGSGERFTAAALTPWGGYVLDPFVVNRIPGTDQAQWIIDPFAFLQAALRLPAMPVPDLTTENGRRLLLSHIDGDGFPSRAELAGSPLAGKVLLDEILSRYRIPVAVSVIEGEVAPHGLHPKDSTEMEAIARRIFRLPHVEIASHSYSHPFRWNARVRHGVFRDADADEAYHLELPGYKFDLEREIVGSMNYIRDRLAPEGKPVRIMLWTGDTAPDEEALRIADEAGLLNMNGGETIVTRSNRSLTGIGPVGIRIGQRQQVFAPISNENLFTNLWRGPFYGFQRVIETFEMTDKPRRLKPIGIYYHTYSASKRASLLALHKIYQWAQAQPAFPLFASEYIRKANDYYTVTIARDGDAWLVRGDGELRNLRLPAGFGPVDISHSDGVAGIAKGSEGHYVHLHGPAATLRFGGNDRPYLADANARLANWQASDELIRFSLAGHQPLAFSLANASRCRVAANGRPLTPLRAADNTVHYRFDHAAATIEARCHAR